MMDFHIFTLFTSMFEGPMSESIIKRARAKGLVNIHLHDIRQYTHDKHNTVDDYPYGGGAGMVLKPGPVFEAVETELSTIDSEQRNKGSTPVILLSPRGRIFTQNIARELSEHGSMVLLCGHYEGIDERVAENLVTDEISIGDFVLTGGELPAMVLIDAICRFVPGVLGSKESLDHDSHNHGLLQYPQYTRPERYREWSVPKPLLSGDHAKIKRWRRTQSLIQTRERRPDLFYKQVLTEIDEQLLEEGPES
jgi:tRNA (guanine37-N1)-methyltransferase